MSIILSNSGTTEQAKDVFQETVISFYENVKKDVYKGDGSIYTYLYSIARFKWLNELKKDSVRKEHHVKATNLNPTEESAINTLFKKEKQAKIIEVLELLGDSCKRILIASIYHNQSMKEIVAELNYGSEQVARNKKYKCLKNLKKLISERPNLSKILKAHD